MENARTFTPAQVASVIAEARTLQNQDCERIAQKQLANDLEERIQRENPEEIPQDVARRIVRELGEKERIPKEYIERILHARYPTTEDHEDFIAATGAHMSEEIRIQRMVDRLNIIAHDFGTRLTTHLQEYNPLAHYRYELRRAKPDDVYSIHLGFIANLSIEQHTTIRTSRPGGWWYRFSTGKQEIITKRNEVVEICDASVQCDYGTSERMMMSVLKKFRPMTTFAVTMNGKNPIFSSCDDAIAAFKKANPDVKQCIPTLHYEIKST